MKMFILCLAIKEVNEEARDKTRRSRSENLTFGVVKQYRNSIKSRLCTSGSSNYDIFGGQETGSFSFFFSPSL